MDVAWTARLRLDGGSLSGIKQSNGVDVVLEPVRMPIYVRVSHIDRDVYVKASTIILLASSCKRKI